MKTTDFSKENPFDWNGKELVLLGNVPEVLDSSFKKQIDQKLSRTSTRTLDGVWGTLGWKNQQSFDLQGHLEYSEIGNWASEGVSLKQIQKIWDFNPCSRENNFKVCERFINFDNIQFSFDTDHFDLDALPELHLTLFLETGEGAIVYYQYNAMGEPQDSDALIEYILPQQTDGQYSSDRDRLDYYFPILPQQEIVYDDLSGRLKQTSEGRKTSFVVKILTYKRNPLMAEELFQEAKQQLNIQTAQTMKAAFGIAATAKTYQAGFLGKRKYALLKYDTQYHGFNIAHSTEDIDSSLKTLLMIHGTFSSTEGSFSDLYGSHGMVLDQLIQEGVFEQIIAFDHPTVSEDVFQNAAVLYQKLEGFIFENPLSILGYSRGALLSRWLACDPNNISFNAKYILNFSAANGVGYFEKGHYVQRCLSILQRILPQSSAKLVVALAQFSANYILSQPGFQQMTPKHPKLERVLEAGYSWSGSKTQAIVADWDKQLSKKKGWQFLDMILKWILGRQHDWVVGAREQRIVPMNSPQPVEIVSMHVKNFDLDFIETNTHQLIYNFFKENS